jgi:hypothetical protein
MISKNILLNLIAKGITSNTDLEELCKSFKIPLTAIINKDQLYRYCPLKNEQNYIINLADHDQQGTHWVGLCLKNNCAYYFDSFGFEMPYEVYKCLKHKKIYYSNKYIQHLMDENCGQFVVLFLYYMKYKDFKSFDALFS